MGYNASMRRFSFVVFSLLLLAACDNTSNGQGQNPPMETGMTIQECLQQYNLAYEGQEILYGRCVADVAAHEKDISLCRSATGMSQMSRDLCVISMAQELVDPQECYSINRDLQAQCFKAMGSNISDRCINADDHEKCMKQLAETVLHACRSSNLQMEEQLACVGALAAEVLSSNEMDAVTEQIWAGQPETGEPNFRIMLDLYSGAINKAIH